MEKTEINLKIPLGYQIIERTKEVDLYSACIILRTRKQKYITTVKKVDDYAVLISHHIKCPYCGKEIPAYSHCWRKEFHALPKKTEAEILKWADIQPALFGEKEPILEVQNYFGYHCEYICRKCGQVSQKSNKYIELSIECIDDKIYVKREIKSLVELVSLKWLVTDLKIKFPIYQQIVFDFDSGITNMEIVGGNDIVFSQNITNIVWDFKGDLLVDLISKNRIVKRVLKRNFEKTTCYKVPFSVQELNFKRFICLARFKGFSKDFYYAIPYRANTSFIDLSFNNVLDKLRNPEFAMELLRDSTIPFCKSVKRLFATQSGLFFYLKECELLYSFLNDVNLFCDFLRSPSAYTFLATAHYYDIKPFLEDYSVEMNKIFLKRIFDNTRFMLGYAIKYSTLNSYGRKLEIDRWHKRGNMFCDIDCMTESVEKTLSLPMHEVPRNIGDCTIGKHFFKWLRTKGDYINASEQLQNCLANWETFDNPVVVVVEGEKSVAAIEVEHNKIIQARLKDNKAITIGTDLYEAIEKWCKKYKIEFNPEKLDDLPF